MLHSDTEQSCQVHDDFMGCHAARATYHSSSSLASETTSPPCTNETGLLARRSITSDSGGVTNVLVVTSSVGMIDRVHGHTTHLRPAVPLHPVLVVGVPCLEHWLLSPASAGNLADHGTAAAGDNLLGTRGELDPARK
uniref:Uncharacterized protein n=1 Tax=Leersia perrieri TaxID=77586 RepID=A0A0D9Y0J5_9ORYZ